MTSAGMSGRLHRFWRALTEMEIQGTIQSCRIRRSGDEVILRMLGDGIDCEFHMPAEVATKLAAALDELAW